MRELAGCLGGGFYCILRVFHTRGRMWGARETEHEDYLQNVSSSIKNPSYAIPFFLFGDFAVSWGNRKGKKRRGKKERVFFGLFYFRWLG